METLLLLDANDDDKRRSHVLTDMNSKLTEKFKSNYKNVKLRMHELISTFESSRPLTKAETTQLNLQQEKEREKEKKEKARKENTAKAELRIKSLVGKAKNLNRVVSDLKETESMTEQQVRENLLETKLWGKKLNDLEAAKEKVDQDLISIDVNNDLKTNLEDEFEDMLRVVKEKIEDLILKDKMLKLYTLAPNKVKENIVYPEVFTGQCGENVFKFVKEFEEAMEANQIRKSDEVKTLLKYVKGEAKVVVGKHNNRNLNEALRDSI